MYLLAALSIGILGSFHCIGMCGPIALSIPVKRTSPFSFLLGSLIYNSGRIVTYAGMGMVFGSLGKGFALAGWQNILSVTLGILILTLLLLPKTSTLLNAGLTFRFLEKLKSGIRNLFGSYILRSLFFIGILNGLLPCGLIYLAIAGALATGDVMNGMLFMAFFGLGTFPAMMAITAARDRISISIRDKIRKAVPVFVGIMALLLILRGMNLGIPYVSPTIKTESGREQMQCCKKP